MSDITVPAGTTVQGLESGIQTPQDWARAILTQGGFPATQSNIDFLVSWAAAEGGNWHNTATYNPLNTTLQVPGSTVMSGGNTAGVQAYQSWSQGITATLDTLKNYSGIVTALKTGNAMQANLSNQLAADFQKWSGGSYSQIGENTAYASTTGGGGDVGSATNPAGGAGAGGQQLSMNDLPAVDSYIRQNWGSDAWLLDIPDVKTVLEQAAVQGMSSAQVQAAIENTNWWKTTSAAVRQYEQDSATNPADYSFTQPGSKADQALADVQSVAGQYGVNLDNNQAQAIALNALKYGWSAQETRIAIAATISGGSQQNTAPGVYKQLKTAAGQYLMNVTDPTLQTWAQNIAAGTQTMDQFNAYLAGNAKVKWSGMASMIDQGMTPNQIVDSYRQEAANIMEVDPNSVDFVNNPIYSKILDYVPPGQTGNQPQDVQHRMMTQSEMAQYLKSQTAYQYTQNARNEGGQVATAITSTWGIT